MAKVKTSEIVSPFFSHDISTRESKEIKRIIRDLGFEGYGLFWALVEFMHKNSLMVGEEDLVIDETFTNKIKQILTQYGLFHIDDNFYISDRILRNINKQEEKSQQNTMAAKIRWALSGLRKIYTEIFGKAPYLNDDEIKVYMKYSEKLESFKEKLPDILYTTKLLKFDNNPDFDPSINWLLAGNHLTKLLNGEYGQLKSWQAHKDYIKRQTEEAERAAEEDAAEENILETFKTKESALEYLAESFARLKTITPDKQPLMKNFGITIDEIKKYKEVCHE